MNGAPDSTQQQQQQQYPSSGKSTFRESSKDLTTHSPAKQRTENRYLNIKIYAVRITNIAGFSGALEKDRLLDTIGDK